MRTQETKRNHECSLVKIIYNLFLPSWSPPILSIFLGLLVFATRPSDILLVQASKESVLYMEIKKSLLKQAGMSPGASPHCGDYNRSGAWLEKFPH